MPHTVSNHRLTASRFNWCKRAHRDTQVATYKSPVATGDGQPSVSGDCNGIHDKEVMRFAPVAFPGFGPLMPWWDLSDGSAVVPVHICEVALLTHQSFPYRAIAVERYIRDIRAGVR